MTTSCHLVMAKKGFTSASLSVGCSSSGAGRVRENSWKETSRSGAAGPREESPSHDNNNEKNNRTTFFLSFFGGFTK